jgi:hypothetical protein
MTSEDVTAPGWGATKDEPDIDHRSGDDRPLSVGRRTALRAGGLLALLGIAQPAAAQQSFEDAACEWRGDVDANGNNLINLNTLEFADGTSMSSASGGGSGSDTRVDIETGSGTITDAEAFGAGSNINISDDGDGTATIAASGGTDTRIDLETASGTIADADAIGAGQGLSLADDTDGTGTLSVDVAASGTATLSSGSVTVDTGVTSTSFASMLAVGVVDPDADAKVVGRAFWDDSAGTHKAELLEDGTSVGSFDVNWALVQVIA